MALELASNTGVGFNLEGTVGTADTLVQADLNHIVEGFTEIEGVESISVFGSAEFDPTPGVVGARPFGCRFTTPLMGGDAGAEPDYAAVLWPACGLPDTATPSGVYSTKSAAPGTAAGDPRTITIGHSIGSTTMRQGVGCMGGFEIPMTMGQLVNINWTFLGKLGANASALTASSLPTALPIAFVNATLSIPHGGSARLNQLNIRSNITTIRRPDASDATGYISAINTGRRITIECDPEFDTGVKTALLAGTKADLTCALTHAQGTITITAKNCQVVSQTPGDREGIMHSGMTLAPTWDGTNPAFSIAYA